MDAHRWLCNRPCSLSDPASLHQADIVTVYLESCVNSLTCGEPQSQASPSSWIPLPQTGSPTTVVGSLKRQRSRFLEPVNPELSWSTLHWLQRVGGLKGMVAAMMHLDVPSGQLQLPVVHSAEKRCKTRQ